MIDREKVIKGLEETSDYFFNVYHHSEDREEINKAKDRCDAVEDALALLKEQQPNTGHWLKKMSNYPSAIAMGGSRTSACDLCGGWGRKAFKYCPHCGAKMEEPTRT